MAIGGGDARRFEPVTIEGRVVRLVPLRPEHSDRLWQGAKESREEIFRWFPVPMETPDDLRRLVEQALDEQQRQLAVAFATVARESGEVIGSTRFMNIDAPNRRVEIGTTWIVPSWQRTAANTEAKYLMLRHAFDHWGCSRVELKTDALNHRSRAAIRRIGAQEEGTLRSHMITWNGRRRDTVYFSILDSEWPELRVKLERMLEG